MMKTLKSAVVAVAVTVALALPAAAQPLPSAEETYKDIEATFGFVPEFLKVYPEVGIAGAWHVMKNFELADTELDAKTKALISLAVASQIPCRYCIWLDTKTALDFGATQAQVEEAVTMAAMTRHWSTVLNGFQTDFDAFQKEFTAE
jgi:AhpD family alkylhydroperoxidase